MDTNILKTEMIFEVKLKIDCNVESMQLFKQTYKNKPPHYHTKTYCGIKPVEFASSDLDKLINNFNREIIRQKKYRIEDQRRNKDNDDLVQHYEIWYPKYINNYEKMVEFLEKEK